VPWGQLTPFGLLSPGIPARVERGGGREIERVDRELPPREDGPDVVVQDELAQLRPLRERELHREEPGVPEGHHELRLHALQQLAKMPRALLGLGGGGSSRAHLDLLGQAEHRGHVEHVGHVDAGALEVGAQVLAARLRAVHAVATLAGAGAARLLADHENADLGRERIREGHDDVAVPAVAEATP
jgi:hypothetical protein